MSKKYLQYCQNLQIIPQFKDKTELILNLLLKQLLNININFNK